MNFAKNFSAVVVLFCLGITAKARAQSVVIESWLPHERAAKIGNRSEESGPALVAPWLVQVSSVYTEEKTGREVRNTGTGMVLEIDGRYFVLCDAHLSQGGKGLSIQHPQTGAVKLSNGGTLANNKTDLELISIENPGIAHVPRGSEDGTVILFGEHPFVSAKAFRHMAVGTTHVVPSVMGLSKTPTTWRTGRKLYSNSVLDSLTDSSDAYERTYGVLNKSYLGDENVSDNKIVPGMSGSPLFKEHSALGTAGILVLDGMVKGYDRYFERSYFSTREQIAELIRAYHSGKRGTMDATRWKYYRQTYRDFGDGTLEINPTVELAGSSFVADAGGGSGGGTNGDGGGGSGGGTNGDGGRSRVAARDDFEALGISAGMKIKGESVLALEAFTADDSLTVYANPAGLDYVRQLEGKGYSVLHQPIGTDLSPLLKKRLQSSQARDTLRHLNRPHDRCLIDLGQLERRGVIRIRLPFAANGSNRYELTLEKTGKAQGRNKSFEPILRLMDPSTGKDLIVDVRGLFFTDIASTSHSRYGDQADRLRVAHIVYSVGDEYLPEPMACYGSTDPQRDFHGTVDLTPPAGVSAQNSPCISKAETLPGSVESLSSDLNDLKTFIDRSDR